MCLPINPNRRLLEDDSKNFLLYADTRLIQREEAQRLSDRQTVQHLQICRLQRIGD